jgi:bifunctional non-homologous end joining protein LigD
MAKPLASYNAKRDFRKTPEPRARPPAKRQQLRHPEARRHAAALRPAARDGRRLKSWAVTKGPSLVPGEKRLAVHVEDHPLDYGAFEGTIPAGQYGGGTVLLWDRGTWEPEFDADKGYAKGHLKFRLDGEKLGGSWHLVRMRARPKERQEQWLLIKSEDDFARAPDAPDILDEEPLSIATGRNLEEIAAGIAKPARKRAAGPKRSGVGSGPAPDKKPTKARTTSAQASAPGKAAGQRKAARPSKARAKMPEIIEPCLATLVSEAPAGAKWLHEIKWDGYRLIAFLDRGKVRLQTRRGHDWTARFPAIARTMATLEVETAVIDGEAVVADENGYSNFSALQQALSDGGDAEAAIFYAFDLLHLDGVDWRERPLEERKARLAGLIPADRQDAVRLSDHVDEDGPAMVRHACRLGMEGIISKRRDLPYRSGRNGDWTKSKCTERQEFVIAGFSPSTALKNAVGSLVLGYHEEGRLRHAGRTGTGSRRARPRSPQAPAPAPAQGPALRREADALQRRDAIWVEPKLVGEVEFRGWTADEHVRHAAFKGLREDKEASEIVREKPQAMAASNREGLRQEAAKPTAKGARPLTGPPRWPALRSPTPTVCCGRSRGSRSKVWPSSTRRSPTGFCPIHPPAAGAGALPERIAKGLLLPEARLGRPHRRHPPRDGPRGKGREEVCSSRTSRAWWLWSRPAFSRSIPGGADRDVERPDRIVMDLDPGEGIEWPQVIEGAREVRERLKRLKLSSFVKTTGGKGLHVVVPLTPKAGWDEVKAFAKSMADQMAADRPERYTATSVKRERQGRIYVDYLRNGRGATAIGPYSTRARPGARSRCRSPGKSFRRR